MHFITSLRIAPLNFANMSRTACDKNYELAWKDIKFYINKDNCKKNKNWITYWVFGSRQMIIIAWNNVDFSHIQTTKTTYPVHSIEEILHWYHLDIFSLTSDCSLKCVTFYLNVCQVRRWNTFCLIIWI